jgi:hypothetical protein
MINHYPTYHDFEKLAHDCLTQAFDIIFETDKYLDEIDEEDLKTESWEYSKGKLNTVIVLIHQGIESLMKAEICLTSPLLLIEGKRTDWPVLPNQTDKNFNDFYTIASESLLHTFSATSKKPINAELIKHIEEIRKLRNQIVHGISKTDLSPKYLTEKILDTYTFFKSKDEWWNAVRNFHFNHPLFGYYDKRYESSIFAEKLDYVLTKVGKNKLSKHFAINIKARKYLCPLCKFIYENEIGENYESMWAFLNPNVSKSTNIICLNCQKSNNVIRKECINIECNGNVIHDGDSGEVCLTCGQDQEE